MTAPMPDPAPPRQLGRADELFEKWFSPYRKVEASTAIEMFHSYAKFLETENAELKTRLAAAERVAHKADALLLSIYEDGIQDREQTICDLRDYFKTTPAAPTEGK